MTVRRKDIVSKVAEKKGLPHDVVKEVMESVFEAILESLERGDRVELRDFGVFSVKKARARMAIDPNTLKPVAVPEKTRPHFKPSKEMVARSLSARIGPVSPQA